jgi:hypothetical protein
MNLVRDLAAAVFSPSKSGDTSSQEGANSTAMDSNDPTTEISDDVGSPEDLQYIPDLPALGGDQNSQLVRAFNTARRKLAGPRGQLTRDENFVDDPVIWKSWTIEKLIQLQERIAQSSQNLEEKWKEVLHICPEENVSLTRSAYFKDRARKLALDSQVSRRLMERLEVEESKEAGTRASNLDRSIAASNTNLSNTSSQIRNTDVLGIPEARSLLNVDSNPEQHPEDLTDAARILGPAGTPSRQCTPQGTSSQRGTGSRATGVRFSDDSPSMTYNSLRQRESQNSRGGSGTISGSRDSGLSPGFQNVANNRYNSPRQNYTSPPPGGWYSSQPPRGGPSSQPPRVGSSWQTPRGRGSSQSYSDPSSTVGTFGTSAQSNERQFEPRPENRRLFDQSDGYSNRFNRPERDDHGLPRLELMKFDGDKEEYELFKQIFDSVVGCRQISSSNKAVRLFSLLQDRPRRLVQSILHGSFDDGSYEAIWEILDQRYGGVKRREINHLQKLLSFGSLKNFSVDELERFYAVLIEIKIHFRRTNDPQMRQPNSIVLLLVKQQLTENHLARYQDWRMIKCLSDNFETFVQWVCHMLEANMAASEETNRRKFDGSQSRSRSIGLFTGNENDDTVALTGEGKPVNSGGKGQRSQNNSHSEAFKVQKCKFCMNKNCALLFKCEKFKNSPVEKRIQFVNENRLCFRCLKSGHGIKLCPLGEKYRCVDGCTSRHNRLLHVSKQNTKVTTSFADDVESADESEHGVVSATLNSSVSAKAKQNGPFVGIQTLTVWVTNGKQRVKAVAALDNCADNTNISSELAAHLGLKICLGQSPGMSV